MVHIPGGSLMLHRSYCLQWKKVYMDKFGKRPSVVVVHAGLECGIIQSNVDHPLDIVSFGPTIVGAHSPDEYVEIESVSNTYDYLISVLEEIG
jgi:Di- and tripeptidases